MKSSSNHVLFVSCPDRGGIIHHVSGVLFRHGLNIIENHEFVDRKNNLFFMRTEFSGGVEVAPILEELKQLLPKQTELKLHSQGPKKLVLLATRESHCLGDLLLRHAAGELNGEIVAVVSQYSTLKKLVDRFEIPFHEVPVPEGERNLHETSLKKVIDSYSPDYLVLAKYMRILTPEFVQHYPDKIINIHHSFLPAFIGSNPYLQAYERGVKIIGATAHYVNDHLDEGPIITQSVIPVTHAQDAVALARAGRDVEKIVLARALSLVLENRVFVNGQKTMIFE